MPEELSLFQDEVSPKKAESIPLAERLRPKNWEDFFGTDGLDQNLLNQIRSGKGRIPSLILWGPPGCGKTTFARLMGSSYQCRYVEVSAVMVGVKEIRELVEAAKHSKLPTLLFVDEIHRFNKAQQDAFLPHVEAGTISLFGATTENPSFYCTGAMLSRCKVLCVPSLEEKALTQVLVRAGKELGVAFAPEAARVLREFSGGDARKLLNLLEMFAQSRTKGSEVSVEEIRSFLKSSRSLVYDRSGEEHYNLASAFIKSLRGSDPDAALYWGFRMIEAGEDPRFVIRRMMIFASEDISNADPRALQVAVATADAFDRLGLPEGRIPIAQCITYLASAPKSNRSYMAMHAAVEAVKSTPKVNVPMHLRNAPTKLMEELGYGENYQYPHNTDAGHVDGVQYLPDELGDQRFYEPSQHGLEKAIGERLALLRRSGRS